MNGRPDQRSDAQLLNETLEDPDAFGEFFDRYYDGLLAYFAGHIRSSHAAADLCAETLAAALDGVERFDPRQGSARQWLYGIARHQLSGYWRDLRVQRDALDRLGIVELDHDGATAAAFARAEASADRKALMATIDRLPRDQADAVRLRVIDELDYAAIADALGCRQGNARVLVHRGLKRLESEFGTL